MYATQAVVEALEERLSAAEDKLDALIKALREYSTSGAEYPQGSTTHFHTILPDSLVLCAGPAPDAGSNRAHPLFTEEE